MAIVLDQLTRRYDGRAVVSNFSLEVPDGSLCVLLGPSGSGKSTVLRLIAGLATPDSGRVLLDGEDLAGVPPQRRDCGFVFQSYALFRRMSVADNVEFGLAVRGVPRAERRRRREELLELVGLAGLGGRLPSQLSGGQQQRVALARALAHRPRVLLLDEPFGALDARIRLELRRSLAQIQRELEVTTLFVTHDQEEAFELADRIAVLAQGRLIENGPPRELYLRPQTEFAAVFLGGANLWVGEATDSGVRLGPVEMPLAAPVRGDGVRRRLQVLVRPEDVALRRSDEAPDGAELGTGEVMSTSFVGSVERLRVRLPALPGVRAIQPPAAFGDEGMAVDVVRAQHVARREPLAPGDRVRVGVRRLHALRHPGLSLAAVDGGAAAEAAREVTRLAQARLAELDHVEALADGTLAEPVDLVFARLPALDAADVAERLLARSGDAHLLLVREPVEMPPRRFLVAVAVGEPGKEDVAFVGRLARHLGSRATVLSVVGLGDDEPTARAAERFVAACARTLVRWGVAAETEVVRGDLATVIERRMHDGHDLLTLGAPLPDAAGRRRWGRGVREILAAPAKYPILVVRPGGAEARP